MDRKSIAIAVAVVAVIVAIAWLRAKRSAVDAFSGERPVGECDGQSYAPAWWYRGWGAWPGWGEHPAGDWFYKYPLFYQWLIANRPDLTVRVRGRGFSMRDMAPALKARIGMPLWS